MKGSLLLGQQHLGHRRKHVELRLQLTDSGSFRKPRKSGQAARHVMSATELLALRAYLAQLRKRHGGNHDKEKLHTERHKDADHPVLAAGPRLDLAHAHPKPRSLHHAQSRPADCVSCAFVGADLSSRVLISMHPTGRLLAVDIEPTH